MAGRRVPPASAVATCGASGGMAATCRASCAPAASCQGAGRLPAEASSRPSVSATTSDSSCGRLAARFCIQDAKGRPATVARTEAAAPSAASAVRC